MTIRAVPSSVQPVKTYPLPAMASMLMDAPLLCDVVLLVTADPPLIRMVPPRLAVAVRVR